MFETFPLENPIIELFTAALLGAFLGIRRETVAQSSHKKSFMGFRTMTLLASMGALSTFFPEMKYLPAVFFAGVVVFLERAYTNGAFNLKRIGLTSEFSAIFIFWIGVLVGKEQAVLAIILTIYLSVINEFKKELHSFIGAINQKEWIGALQLLTLSGAVLPFLPKDPIDPWGVLVPFNIWFLVILISGIGFFGYFLTKIFGAKGGIPLTGFLGATVSSTAVTTSMASQSKRAGITGIFAVGILIAIATMHLRVIGEIILWGGGVIPSKFFLVPFSMTVVAGLYAFYHFKKTSKNHNLSKIASDVKLKSPFEIKPALKFGIFFVVVLLALAIGQKYLGNSGVYVASILSGLVGVDAIVLSSLESVKLGEMSSNMAQNAIGLAIFVNTLIKILYISILGSKKLVKKMSVSIVIICLVGVGVLFLI